MWIFFFVRWGFHPREFCSGFISGVERFVIYWNVWIDWSSDRMQNCCCVYGYICLSFSIVIVRRKNLYNGWSLYPVSNVCALWSLSLFRYRKTVNPSLRWNSKFVVSPPPLVSCCKRRKIILESCLIYKKL